MGALLVLVLLVVSYIGIMNMVHDYCRRWNYDKTVMVEWGVTWFHLLLSLGVIAWITAP